MDYINAFWVGGFDLCSCPDFNGKDKNAAGKDHGFDRMFRCGVRSSRNL